jgi:hypothetical protein
MYNVLEKLRTGSPLTINEHKVHTNGVVSVLRELHDELDAAVSDAYGWPATLSDEEVLGRLVALNAERKQGEDAGTVQWLRPTLQMAGVPKEEVQVELIDAGESIDEKEPGAIPVTAWPKTMPERIAAVRTLVESVPKSWSVDAIAGSFKNARRKDVEGLLDSLASLGVIASFKTTEGKRWRRLGKVLPFKPPTAPAAEGITT